MKILAIGNSFSEDSTRYIQDIAKNAGENLFVRNIYIGGCSLKRHANNIKTGAEDYAYEEDCQKIRMISIGEAVEAEEWDWITVQQCSGDSGLYGSYEPYLTEIIDFVRSKHPSVKIAFNRTWAYEIDHQKPEFLNYGRDQIKMYNAIVDATEKIAKAHGISIIESGDAIQRVRGLKEFDYANGGISLCRDGFHLSHEYGRFVAGLVWFKFFTGRDVRDVTFIPSGADALLVKKILELI